MRGRMVVVLRVEHRAARKRERNERSCGDGTRGWNEDVLRPWQHSLRPWPGGDGRAEET